MSVFQFWIHTIAALKQVMQLTTMAIVRKPNPIFSLNPASSVIVFFSSDSVSGGSRLTYPGGCGVLTLEQFEIFKMATINMVDWS